MQARYRSSGDGFRSGSGYRNFNRGGFSRAHPKPYPSPQPPPPPPPPRKADIFLEAGRLAADYLVSKGLLPPDSLPGKWPSGRFQEFKGQDREPLVPEGRTSALARLGNPVLDVGHGKKRYNDEYHHMGSRSYSRGRKRNGPYSRGYGSEWGRENGRKGPWMERARGYPDTMEGEDDFAPGYQRVRRGGFYEVGSSASRVGSDERLSKSEVTGESGSEVENYEMADDTGSKMSSSSTWKDPLPEADADVNKVLGDVKVSSSETIDEVKSDASGDLKKKNQQEEGMDVSPCAVEGDLVNKHGDLFKLCFFAKVPTKPRSSLIQRSPNVDQGSTGEASSTFGDASAGVSEVIAEEEPIKVSSSDSHSNENNISKCQAPDISSTLPDQPMEETVDPQPESSQCPPGFGTSRETVDATEKGSFTQHIDRMEGITMQRDSAQENEYSLQNLGLKKSNPYVEKLPTDEEMVEVVGQEKPVGADADLFPKVEPEFNVKMEEEKQLLPSSFKICDLNLMGTPEITEIPDDPVVDHLHTSASILESGKELPVDVDLSIGNNTNGVEDYSQLSGDDKVVPVINLEDDSPIEDNACDSSKLKNETIYSSLDNFLSQTEHPDLPGIQDGYSLAFPAFLGTDISGCPSVPSDLNNLQTGMGLHDAEVLYQNKSKGVPGDDDPIYVSLGEIPISFMEVWDQPSQEYGKYF